MFTPSTEQSKEDHLCYRAMKSDLLLILLGLVQLSSSCISYKKGNCPKDPLKIHPITQSCVLCGPCGSGQLWGHHDPSQACWVVLSGLSVEQKVLNTHVVPFGEVFPDTLVVGGPRVLQHEDSTWQGRAKVAHWGASLETIHD